MKNNSLKEIAQQLSEAKSILLFPHINLDGDALGSTAALCKALRLAGKEAWILLEDDIPANLRFLDKGYCTWDKDQIAEPDICMCVDCGDKGRFEKRADKFDQGKETICIDHHRTTNYFCDYNYVDSEEAATGQIVFQLIKELGTAPNKEIGEAIYAAIITDTGNYQYSNTQKRSHEITMELYDWGIDCNKVSVEIYENIRMEKILLKNLAMETLKVLEGGKGACFMVGYSHAKLLSDTLQVPLVEVSHQQGHVAASLWSAGRMDLMDKTHLAWHLSGGTTELLLVEPEGRNVRCTRIGGTTDISAGQLIDRTGQLLELPFPAGKHLDSLSDQAQGREVFKVKCPGLDFSLSGVQNKVQQFHAKNENKAETAAYALRCVANAVYQASKNALDAYPGLEIVFSGGVASNSMLREILKPLNPVFAQPQYSTDNAMGVAILATREG